MKKTCIYTVITNGYDTPQRITPEPFIDYLLFTDNINTPVDLGWKVIFTKEPQRCIKIYPPPEVQEYEQSIYIDGNITPVRIQQFLTAIPKGAGIFIFSHPKRKCFIAEHYACIEQGKADPDLIRKQLIYNIELGIKPEQGMYQTGIIYRKHTNDVLGFCKTWLSELKKHTHRDQLSIMTSLHLNPIHIDTTPWASFARFFRISQHLVKPRPKIWYFVPYDTEGNIGRGLNEHCELVPRDDDWIVIRDGDTMFQNPKWGILVEKAIVKHGGKYALIGAMTNRVGGTHQCIDGMFGEMSLLRNWEVSEQIAGTDVIPTTGVAGFFMAFQKRTWIAAGKFTEQKSESHVFDTVFNNSVRKIGGKIGLMTGVYVTHSYRIWEGADRAKSRGSVKHLLK